MQRDAIILTLGKNFLDKMYPGGRETVIEALERTNISTRHRWMQFSGSGIPSKKVEFCYLVWDGKVQYRLNIKEYQAKITGSFNDGGVERTFKNRNLVVMEGPAIKAPHNIPMKGFQGIRYTEFLF